jgi:hypothetical protein
LGIKGLCCLPDDIDDSNNIYAEKPEAVRRLRAAAFDAELTKKSPPAGQVH